MKRGEPKGNSILRERINLIELCSDMGAGTDGAALGIDALRHAASKFGFHYFADFPYSRISSLPFHRADNQDHLWMLKGSKIVDHSTTSAEQILNCLESNNFPLIISGDHSNAISGISACKKRLGDKKLGVIWVDAHADLHSPFSSPSGNVHGMPLAAVLGRDNNKKARNKPSKQDVESWDKLKNLLDITPKVDPENIVFLGIRDLEKEEWDIIKELGIQYYNVEEISQLGTDKVLESCDKILSNCDGLYLSFDVDSIEKGMVPGTGTPVERGLNTDQAIQILRHFWNSEKLVAMEFTEINPTLDIYNQTAELSAKLLHELLED